MGDFVVDDGAIIPGGGRGGVSGGVFSVEELRSLCAEGVDVDGEGSWRPETTAKLLQEMDQDGNGRVTQQEFSLYFDEHLPSSKAAFDADVLVETLEPETA